jgi:hypothetical protein
MVFVRLVMMVTVSDTSTRMAPSGRRHSQQRMARREVEDLVHVVFDDADLAVRPRQVIFAFQVPSLSGRPARCSVHAAEIRHAKCFPTSILAATARG